ncbi:MAG: EAL domain-containing protein [Chitinivibrionales bacterium]|nr:EAL domain-containing protein [Chitinivibrionales bacterium]
MANAVYKLLVCLKSTSNSMDKTSTIKTKSKKRSTTAASKTAPPGASRKPVYLDTSLLFKAVMSGSSEGIMITDVKGAIVKVNNTFCEATGYTAGELIGKNPRILKSGRHPRAFYKDIWDTVSCGKNWQGEIWDRKKSGDLILKRLSISAIDGGGPEKTLYIGIFTDLERRIFRDEALTVNAYFDTLTGLPNRAFFIENLKHLIYESKRTGGIAAVFFVDIDRFKNINDSYGHQSGDQLLLQVADRIRPFIRKSDFTARFGDDEFTFAFGSLENVEDIKTVALRLRALFSEPFVVGAKKIYATASFGISVYPSDGDDADVLIRNADNAVAEAKRRGKNTFAFFSHKMNIRAQERIKVENELYNAIQDNQFELYYQPIVELDAQQVCGFEALIRWAHPESGVISPMTFIPIAEETGMIIQIGRMVLTKATKKIRQIQDLGYNDVYVSVNISSMQFRKLGFFDACNAIIDAAGISPTSLKIELTESIVMHSTDETVDTLERFRARGISILIDDFGTGYSSLSYLRNLPIDILKIDRSFISEIENKRDALAVATSIINLAHNLNMKVIAEGVETEEQMRLLQRNSCDMVQGYYFSKPIEDQKALDFLQAFRAHA